MIGTINGNETRQPKIAKCSGLLEESSILVGSVSIRARIDTLPTKMLLSSNNPEHLAIFGWRVSLPLIVPIMALFAIPLSRTDSRRGRYAQLGPALLVFLLYFVATK